MIDLIDNPYVGPRTFKEEEQHLFFGREREAKDLLSLVLSERLVLFYAQSGAGKSSLINTRLIPGLRQRGFDFLPIGRVSGELPEGIIEVDNIFVFNLILSLDQNQHEATSFIQTTLSDYFRQYQAETENNHKTQQTGRVLIIDQFEEIFTMHTEYWGKREDFFEQLRKVINVDPSLWVVLSMREDYVAVLAPYARLLPGKLRTRFYMQPLNHKAALEAIEQPAEKGGRSFAPGVAQTLVDNLRQIRIQGQETETYPGEFIEPVQLQVVCYRMWEHLKERSSTEITPQDLQELGNVDTALTVFYEETLHKVLKKTKMSERRLRTWFNTCLITPSRKRGLVYRGETETEGLPNQAVDILNDAYLIRTNIRGADTWYELTHDRLVEPILEANQSWQKKQPPLTLDALAWWASKDPQKLYRGNRLKEAQAYAKVNGDDLSQEEKAFLEASTHQQSRKRQQLFVRYGAIVLLFVVVVLILLAFQQKSAADHAKKQSRIHLAESLAAQARIVDRANNTELATLLTLEALRLNRSAGGNAQELIDSSLRELLNTYPFNRVLTGHEHRVLSVDFSPDGLTLASGSYDRTIRLWNLRDLTEPPKILNGHQAQVNSVAFSPDGVTLASGSSDKTIRLWNVETGQLISEPLIGHTSDVLSLAFTPDGMTLASASKDRTIRLWDLRDLTASPRILNGHQNHVNSVAFSPDGMTLASGSSDKTIRLWNVETGQLISEPLLGHTSDVLSLAFTPDGHFLASGGDDKIIRFWNVETRQLLVQPALTGHEERIRSLTFSPDGQLLASSSDDLTIRLWNNWHDPTASPTLLTGHQDWILSVAFSPDGLTLASGSHDEKIRLWDLSLPKAAPVSLTSQSPRRVFSIAFSPDEANLLASGDEDGTIRLWNLDDPTTPLGTLSGHQGPVDSVTFSPDGVTLASGSRDNTIRLWEVSDPTAPVTILTGHQDRVNSVAFHPNEPLLASGSKDKTILLWDLQTSTIISTALIGHEASVNAVAFSPKEPILASGSDDNTVRLWDVQDPMASPSILVGHQASVKAVAFSPDGQMLASGGEDQIIRLWDIRNPVITSTRFVSTDFTIRSIAFSSDKSEPVLAAGGDDKRVYLWNLNDLTARPTTLIAHKDWITSVAFSPDGLTLASGSYDRRIYLWIPQIDRLVSIACQQVQRNLTKAEWERYLPEEEYQQTCPNWPAHPSMKSKNEE